QTVDGGVFRRLALLDCLDRRFFDVVRSLEVRLAGAKSDHVAAGKLERARLVRHRDGGGRLDPMNFVREQGHGCLRSSPICAWRRTFLMPGPASGKRYRRY